MCNVLVSVRYKDNSKVSFLQEDTSIEMVIHCWDVIAEEELDEEKSIYELTFRYVPKQTMF